MAFTRDPPMRDTALLAETICRGIVQSFRSFLRNHPADTPYAFALIGGQIGDSLNFAIATEQALSRTAADYEKNGYRYRGHRWEKPNQLEKLSSWLRWANPDDGWYYGDFARTSGVQRGLKAAAKSELFGPDAEGFEEFCTDLLGTLAGNPEWQALTKDFDVVVGFTWGEDPRDFLRSATRANPYPRVMRLWEDHFRTEGVEHRISKPK